MMRMRIIQIVILAGKEKVHLQENDNSNNVNEFNAKDNIKEEEKKSI